MLLPGGYHPHPRTFINTTATCQVNIVVQLNITSKCHVNTVVKLLLFVNHGSNVDIKCYYQGRSKQVDRVDTVQQPEGSRGPPTKTNQKNTIGLGPLTVPCPWAPMRVLLCLRLQMSLLTQLIDHLDT